MRGTGCARNTNRTGRHSPIGSSTCLSGSTLDSGRQFFTGRGTGLAHSPDLVHLGTGEGAGMFLAGGLREEEYFFR